MTSYQLDYSVKLGELLVVLSGLLLAFVNIRIGWKLKKIDLNNSRELENMKNENEQRNKNTEHALKKIEIRLQGIHQEKLSIGLSVYRKATSLLSFVENLMTPEGKNSTVIIRGFGHCEEDQQELKEMLSVHDALLTSQFKEATFNLVAFCESVSIDHGMTLDPDSSYKEYLDYYEKRWINVFYPKMIKIKDTLNESFQHAFDEI